MATRSPLLRIHDMLESIRGIEKAIAGKTFRDYERSWVLRSAVERGIEVISEASRHLGRELSIRMCAGRTLPESATSCATNINGLMD
jgi:uncharacterized protein with HEPN domain